MNECGVKWLLWWHTRTALPESPEEIWQDAWNARGKVDAEICREFSDSGFLFADVIEELDTK